MWAAPLSTYSPYGFAASGRSVPVRKGTTVKNAGTASSDASASVTRPSSQPGGADASDWLEPAVDRPPSPERIRALNKQMKRASLWDGQGSSTARSPPPDRPSWEHSLEHISLSRHSSGRSTSSSMPSRERPESVQLFGKTIFNRGTRLKRESSANSSSGSSLYSTDRSVDGTAPPAKEYIPGLFSRKKTQLKSDATLDRPSSDHGSKKLQISGPFNLHHHAPQTRRDRLPQSRHGQHWADLVSSDSPALRAAPAYPSAGTPAGYMEAGDAFYQSPNIRQDAAFVHSSTSGPGRTMPPPQRQRGFSAPRRLVKRTRSQEQLHVSASKSPAPPRPPRSPVDPTPPPPRPPAAPPRLSDRASLRYDGFDDFDPLEDSIPPPGRPQTSGSGFHQPEMFGGSAASEVDMGQLEDHDRNFSPSPHLSHALTTPDDAAWPLKTNATFPYETPLPNVPEEEENHGAARRSQLSLASNKSSLRGSHSVPMLRQVAQLQSNGTTQRPPSGGSDTLGPFGALSGGPLNMGTDGGISVSRESWEDDIDYCYEHEAEADFDYDWDRPSLEISRESEILSSVDEMDKGEGETREDDWAADTASGMGPPVSRDPEPQSFGLKPVPARHLNISVLSPAESVESLSGAAGPTTAQQVSSTAASQSPHVRAEPKYRRSNRLHVRTSSRASSFKESHGFTLSPSLLIPRDFQQQVVMAESDVDKFRDGSTTRTEDDFPYADEAPMTLSTSGLYINDRHSTSTTGSNSTGRTSSSEERHVSTHSDSTALTRYTASTIFENWNPKAAEASEPVPSVQLETFSEVSSPKRARAPTSPVSDTEYATTRSTGDERDGDYGGVYGDAQVYNDQAPQTVEPAKQPVRQRGHTNNLSVSGRGYALFPPAYAGNRV